MTVFVTRRSGALVAIARSGAQDDPLPDLTRMLGSLVENYDRIVLDLSDVALAPPARIAALLVEVENHQHESGAEIVLVANRPSARRLLRAMAAGQVAVLSCVNDATSRSAAEKDDPDAVDGYEDGALGTARPSKI